MNSITFKLALFVFGILIHAFIFILLIRLLLQKFNAPYYNTISLWIVKMTGWIVNPCQKLLPNFRGFDLSIVVLIFLLEFFVSFLLIWGKFNIFPTFFGCLLLTIGNTGDKIVDVFFYSILLYVLMNWLPMLQNHPIASLIRTLSLPLLTAVRRFIPPVYTFDLSPLVILIGLKMISLFICLPLIQIGIGTSIVF